MYKRQIHDRVLAEQALKEEEAYLEEMALELRRLSHRLLEVQEQERGHIARELHDEVGQSLTAAIINLQSEMQADTSFAYANEHLQQLNTILCQVRDMALDLRPSMLDDLGLESALQWLLDRQASAGQLRTYLNFTRFPNERLHHDLEITLYRLVQEALTNVIKHSGAERVWVSLVFDEGQVQLCVDDDGCGLGKQPHTAADARQHFGMAGMRERSMLVGGELEFSNGPKGGVRVFATLLMEPQAPSMEALRARS